MHPGMAQRHKVWLYAQRWVPSLSTQYLQNSAESGERSVLTIGSLCLLCCVRIGEAEKIQTVNFPVTEVLAAHGFDPCPTVGRVFFYILFYFFNNLYFKMYFFFV